MIYLKNDLTYYEVEKELKKGIKNKSGSSVVIKDLYKNYDSSPFYVEEYGIDVIRGAFFSFKDLIEYYEEVIK